MTELSREELENINGGMTKEEFLHWGSTLKPYDPPLASLQHYFIGGVISKIVGSIL